MDNKLQIIRNNPFLFFGILILVTYVNTLGNGYNFDDHLVTINHHLTSANTKNSFLDIFTKPYYSDKMGYNYGYRPIALLSFYIENHLFGENPLTSHLINVLLFSITVITLYKFILSLKLDGGENIAIFASIFFAIHPIHTEVVNSIKNRDELLALLLGLISLKVLLKYEDKKPQILIYSCILFGLGLLSKKSIIPLAYIAPAILLFIKGVHYKHFLVSAISLITTAYIVGGGLNSTNALSFILVSIFYLLIILVVNKWKYTIKWISEIQISKRVKLLVIIALQFLVYIYVLWSKQFEFILLSVPLNFYLHKIYHDKLLYLLVLQLIFIDYWIGYKDFGLISIFIAVGLFVKNYSGRKLDSSTIILSLLTIFLFNYNNFLPILNSATIIVTLLFFYTLEKKIIFSYFLTIVTTASAFYFKDIPILGLLMLSVIILKSVAQKQFLGLLIPIAVSVSVLAIIIHPSINRKLSIGANINEQVKSISSSIEDNSNNMQEGRSLSYIENPLIGDHTSEELTFTGLSVLGTYLYLNVFPYELSFYYGFSKVNVCNVKDAKAWLSLIIHIILVIIAIWKFKKHPLVTIGIFWYIASILLFSNWVELVAGVIGERLSYTASVGFSIFVSGLLFWILPDLSSKRYRLIRVSIVLVFILLFVRTIERNTLWASPVKLMSHDIEHLNNSAQANNMLAIALMSEAQKATSLSEKEKHIENALSHFKKTISIYPKFFNAHIDIAKVYILQGRLNEAKKHLIIAHNIDPKSILVLEELIKINFDTNNLYALINYADQYLKLDQKNQLVYELVTHKLFINSNKNLALKYANLGLAQFPQNPNLLYIIKSLSYPNGN